jgi:hypothetical protein
MATAADIVDERQEVIRGELVSKDSATFEHAATHGAISAVLGVFIGRSRPGRVGGWWLGASVEVELETHEVYLPDVAGWRIDRVPEPPSAAVTRTSRYARLSVLMSNSGKSARVSSMPRHVPSSMLRMG